MARFEVTCGIVDQPDLAAGVFPGQCLHRQINASGGRGHHQWGPSPGIAKDEELHGPHLEAYLLGLRAMVNPGEDRHAACFQYAFQSVEGLGHRVFAGLADDPLLTGQHTTCIRDEYKSCEDDLPHSMSPSGWNQSPVVPRKFPAPTNPSLEPVLDALDLERHGRGKASRPACHCTITAARDRKSTHSDRAVSWRGRPHRHGARCEIFPGYASLPAPTPSASSGIGPGR